MIQDHEGRKTVKGILLFRPSPPKTMRIFSVRDVKLPNIVVDPWMRWDLIRPFFEHFKYWEMVSWEIFWLDDQTYLQFQAMVTSARELPDGQWELGFEPTARARPDFEFERPVPFSDLEEDFQMVKSALRGGAGEDPRRIAKEGIEWIAQLIRKNKDYGSSVWKEPELAPGMDPDLAIRVRMSDKVSRIRSLLANKEALTDETLEDSIRDLGAYCLLWLACPDRRRTK